MNDIEVYVELKGKPILAGILFTHGEGRRELSFFNYDQNYLATPGAYALEPAMPLKLGNYSFSEGLPKSFLDASPDNWGRALIERGLQKDWVLSGTPSNHITEMDYLMETSDMTRQGALRFKFGNEEDFEASGTDVPKLLTLPALLDAAQKICSEEGVANDYQAVRTLLDAGSGSLGGARPKSSVIEVDAQGREILYLAKFPHPKDSYDVMRWEKIALELASLAGIETPDNRLICIDGANVLLLRRFDRTDEGYRIGYMSALTLLQTDMRRASDYLQIADELTEISGGVSDDLAQLWRRIVFSYAINNTDDHLRNHGLLRHKNSWRLSPAFDINADMALEKSHVTAIGGADTYTDAWAMIHQSYDRFRLKEKDATKIMAEVGSAFSQWRATAHKYDATDDELRRFAPIFERAMSGF